MEKALVFKIKGKQACFRNFSETGKVITTHQIPDKFQLAGILGAILGLGGYGDLTDRNTLENTCKQTECLEKLSGIEYAILQNKAKFSKKYITVNNSTALYFSKKGTMQLVFETLEDVEYEIVVRKSEKHEEIYKELKTRLEKNQAEFNIYLGKTDYFADIEYIDEEELTEVENAKKVDSWFLETDTNKFLRNRGNEQTFLTKEGLFTEQEDFSILKKNKQTHVLTNSRVDVKKEVALFKALEKTVRFLKI